MKPGTLINCYAVCTFHTIIILMLVVTGFISYLDDACTDKRSYMTYYVRTIYIYISSAVVLLRHSSYYYSTIKHLYKVICFTYCFVCLIFSLPLENFSLVLICYFFWWRAAILTYSKHSWQLSSEGSLACQALLWHRTFVFKVIFKDLCVTFTCPYLL